MTRPETADHGRHDLDLLAAAADRGATPELKAAAAAQAGRCDTCADLFADLRSVATGLTTLPRSISVPRDMRLTPADAARLSRGRGWRGFLGRFAPGATPVLVPFASALTTLGVAGILLTTVLGGGGLAGAAFIPSLGGAAAASASSADRFNAGEGSSAPAAAGAPGTSPLSQDFGSSSPKPQPPEAASPAATGGGRTASGEKASDASASQGVTAVSGPTNSYRDSSGGNPAGIAWPLLLSTLLVVAGLGLFGLRFAASRTR